MPADESGLGGLGPAQAPEATGHVAALAYLELIATAALAVLFALLAAQFAIQAVHVGGKASSRLPSMLAAVGCILLAAICTRVAIWRRRDDTSGQIRICEVVLGSAGGR